MKQHPVPQNITSYQFRLVGDMTLKQFLELAAGVVVAYFTFYLRVPAFIKWPLIVSFSFLGIALAFLPIEGRPLDKWIINFIKSIYSPTRYLWQKKNQPPDFLRDKPISVSRTKTTAASPKKDKAAFKEYLATFSPVSAISPLDQEEKKQLEKISQLWRAAPTTPLTIEPAPPLAPPIAVESRFQVKQNIRPEVAAMFSHQLAIPNPPTIPNIVVGMVLTPGERILPNALIEIKDFQGNTLRALKTNKLGQFSNAAPLDSGNYKVEVEHEDYQFDIINLKAEGKIIPPIKIKAKPKNNQFLISNN